MLLLVLTAVKWPHLLYSAAVHVVAAALIGAAGLTFAALYVLSAVAKWAQNSNKPKQCASSFQDMLGLTLKVPLPEFHRFLEARTTAGHPLESDLCLLCVRSYQDYRPAGLLCERWTFHTRHVREW
jgi:hypothetical protein